MRAEQCLKTFSIHHADAYLPVGAAARADINLKLAVAHHESALLLHSLLALLANHVVHSNSSLNAFMVKLIFKVNAVLLSKKNYSHLSGVMIIFINKPSLT